MGSLAARAGGVGVGTVLVVVRLLDTRAQTGRQVHVQVQAQPVLTPCLLPKSVDYESDPEGQHMTAKGHHQPEPHQYCQSQLGMFVEWLQSCCPGVPEQCCQGCSQALGPFSADSFGVLVLVLIGRVVAVEWFEEGKKLMIWYPSLQ